MFENPPNLKIVPKKAHMNTASYKRKRTTSLNDTRYTVQAYIYIYIYIPI